MSYTVRPRRALTTHRFRLLAICLATLGSLLTASCGSNVQTLQPYTPADGVNINVGDGDQVQVRNLLIISDEGERGVLSATLYAERADALIAVSGQADALDGDGAPLTATLPQPIEIGVDGFVILTDLPPVTITSAALEPGLTAELTLRFRNAGSVTLSVPVLPGDMTMYDEVTEFETPR